jgi:hypothetical protein
MRMSGLKCVAQLLSHTANIPMLSSIALDSSRRRHDHEMAATAAKQRDVLAHGTRLPVMTDEGIELYYYYYYIL